ncbi:DMT family transporter [Oceaniferula flava]|uniref:DMT family transporter n=1 Tax=Oceaniferula flava TaxID=2800421 RepID=A0AAE2V9J3_9BACT|nr:DMT family transporter [Oceaniferula flavus]MBK1855223.1 DMT family transporter [Oceaniferula flavus]
MHTLADQVQVRRGFLSPKTTGYLVLYSVVIIWAGFALTLRAISTSGLTTADVALIRFAVPVLALLPAFSSRFAEFKKLRLRDVLMVLCGGLPFFFIASAGARTTSAVHVGALVAGTAPLSVSLVYFLIDRRRLPRRQLLPLSIIIAGALGLIIAQPAGIDPETLRGIGYLLVASLFWGIYSVGLRSSGLDAIGNGIVLAVGSLVMLVTLMLTGVVPSHLDSITLHQAVPFLLIQGLGVGLLSTVGYAFAISRLGTAKSATIGSLAPALAAILAVPFLGESITFSTAISVFLITVGVILSNRSAT